MNYPAIRDMIQAGRFEDARQACGKLLQRNSNDVNAMSLLAIALIELDRFADAEKVFQHALRLKPSVPELHHNLGAVLRALGRFDDAERHYLEALRLKPDYCEAYFNLAAARKFKPSDPMPDRIESLLTRDDLSEDDRGFLHFAAGKIYNDQSKYDLAFAHYRKGNQCAHKTFDREQIDQYLRECAEVFDKSMRQRFGLGLDDQTPVFIVGMPRSGTTLVEQVLASHSAVFGAGELNDVMAIAHTLPRHAGDGASYPRCLPSLPDEVYRGFAAAYLKRVRRLAPGAKRIVDKMPQNFLHLGLIALMFPQARVIHCRRDRLDTCLSCYFQRFRDGYEYTFELDDLAYYYCRYEQLMDFWRGVLPNAVLEIQYESLVEDQEAVSREMIAFCGLPWEDACLRFNETDRLVSNASNWQVRRPMNREGLKRWRQYEKHLQPLISGLAKYGKA